jgi:tight adherence protein B
MEILVLAFCSSLFIFALVIIGANLFLREKIQVEKRINGIAVGLESKSYFHKEKNKKSFLHKLSWLFEGKALKKIANLLSLAAIPLRAEEFLVIWGIAALVPAGLVALFNFNIFVCIALVAAGVAVPPFLLQSAWRKRMSLFDKQLIDALAIIGNCLRAGFSFNQAIESIAQEMPDPIAKEFAKTIREIRLGFPMEKALINMMERLDNNDLELIVSAVLIQRQVGGNLSEILDTIANTIKDRLKIKGEIKVLTATGRTSGMVVGMLPVFLMGVLMVINPGYVSMFFNSAIGIAMLIFAAIMETTGFLIVKKIVNVKF